VGAGLWRRSTGSRRQAVGTGWAVQRSTAQRSSVGRGGTRREAAAARDTAAAAQPAAPARDEGHRVVGGVQVPVEGQHGPERRRAASEPVRQEGRLVAPHGRHVGQRRLVDVKHDHLGGVACICSRAGAARVGWAARWERRVPAPLAAAGCPPPPAPVQQQGKPLGQAGRPGAPLARSEVLLKVSSAEAAASATCSGPAAAAAAAAAAAGHAQRRRRLFQPAGCTAGCAAAAGRRGGGRAAALPPTAASQMAPHNTWPNLLPRVKQAATVGAVLRCWRRRESLPPAAIIISSSSSGPRRPAAHLCPVLAARRRVRLQLLLALGRVHVREVAAQAHLRG
jgi:hypothetical protein